MAHEFGHGTGALPTSTAGRGSPQGPSRVPWISRKRRSSPPSSHETLRKSYDANSDRASQHFRPRKWRDAKLEYMPVVVAPVEALADPLYNYHGPVTSTGGSAVFMVLGRVVSDPEAPVRLRSQG